MEREREGEREREREGVGERGGFGDPPALTLFLICFKL